MKAIQIVRETEQFPEMERIDENVVNFYFDHSERPYGENTQYMAVMITVDYPEDEEKEDDIEEVKALALLDIKNYRISQIESYDTSANVNDMVYLNKHMWFDKVTRATISYSMLCEKNAGASTTVLIAPDGEQYTLNIDLALSMFAQLEIYAKRCFNVTGQHKAAVQAFDNADDVISYDITADYPEKLNFDDIPSQS